MQAPQPVPPPRRAPPIRRVETSLSSSLPPEGARYDSIHPRWLPRTGRATRLLRSGRLLRLVLEHTLGLGCDVVRDCVRDGAQVRLARRLEDVRGHPYPRRELPVQFE